MQQIITKDRATISYGIIFIWKYHRSWDFYVILQLRAPFEMCLVSFATVKEKLKLTPEMSFNFGALLPDAYIKASRF